MKIFLAPMVGRTDKYFRKLVRIISPNIIMFTEMITVDSLIRGNLRNYNVNRQEHPLVAQIAGNDSDKFIECAEILTKSGFDEINLNIGCPSAKVVKGGFGACQIIEPFKVAEFVEAIKSCTDLPVSIKTRQGLGYDQDLDDIKKLIYRRLREIGLEWSPKNSNQLEQIQEECGTLVMNLKKHYNRARPFQMAHYTGQDLHPFNTISGQSPAYPSGHAFQSRFLLKIVAFNFPQYKDKIKKLAEDIAFTRIVMGVHFPSDNKFGFDIADKLATYPQIRDKYFTRKIFK